MPPEAADMGHVIPSVPAALTSYRSTGAEGGVESTRLFSNWRSLAGTELQQLDFLSHLPCATSRCQAQPCMQ